MSIAQVRSCTPDEMKRMLEADGAQLMEEDEFHWRFHYPNRQIPIILPKQGEYVSLPMLNQIIYDITGWGMRGYFDRLKRQASSSA